MPEHELIVRTGGKKLRLSLHQKPNPGGIPVLLLHGASANHNTFLNPVGDPKDPRCLADWLILKGFEPWMLDWRGNGLIESSVLRDLRDHFHFDAAAELDIPAALERIKEKTGKKRICAVGHCMGAASLAQAIAGGLVEKEPALTHVVLLAIGLFYEPAMDGRVKGQDFALERLWDRGPGHDAIDPRPNGAWPDELDEFYQNWPASLRPHQQPQSKVDEICNRVSFMFGQPYLERQLHPALHEILETQFGAIPLRMYLHGAQNIRRGWAAKFDARNDDDSLIGRLAQERFAHLERVTLITGVKNEIWHRDSIDRMYEWLRGVPAGRRNSHREIVPDYAHQDLLWGKDAYNDIFPKILKGLQ